ncbi:MAG TPA: DUF1207 domain-containing protein [Bacteroidota bacterium]|nr:DUF1207 domain-containing protein [Bacteroidota bacterium]
MKCRHKLILFFLPCILYSQALQKIEILPQKRIVPIFTADAVAHRMGVTSINIGRRVSISLGNILPVLDLVVYDQKLRLNLGGSVHAELEPDDRASLVTTDYFVDYILVDIPFTNDFILRMGAGHSSHHLSDNWFELLQKTKSLVYSKDYVRLFVVKKIPSLNLFVYVGAVYSYYFVVDQEIFRPWALQCGGEKDIASYYNDMLTLYGAFDIKVRQESSFAATHNYQFGLRLQNHSERSLRLAYQFRTGIDERGQYYTERRSFHGLSLFIDI